MVQGKGSLKTFAPGFQLNRPNNQIWIPKNLRTGFRKYVGKFSFQLILVYNDQFACRTVATRFAEDC